jgi:hypothetical protein
VHCCTYTSGLSTRSSSGSLCTCVRETSSCGGFHAYMPSAFILAVRGYPAMPLARQLEHQRYVPSSPLVLGRKPLTFPAPTTDRDRPVSRRSKPSSRTAFIGEQPNPWELLHPHDAMSRHRMIKLSTISGGIDYVFILLSILADCYLPKPIASKHDLICLEQESACCNDSVISN